MSEPKPTAPRLNARKVYVKDLSFESPGSPTIFLNQSLTPSFEINLEINFQQIDDKGAFYEVVLKITANAKQEDKNLFLAEIQQAGIFEINAADNDQKGLMLNVAAPHLLLPFAREELASVVSKGGYPQLLLNPMNFESIYRQKIARTKSTNPAPETIQ